MAGSTRVARERIEREARVSGLRDFRTPSLEAVERRRKELWTALLALFLVVAAAMVVASSLPAVSRARSWFSPQALRISLLVLAVAFGVYAVEKEHHLRRLSRLLIDERVLTAALSNRLKEISALMTAGRAINSVLELRDVLDIILSSALDLLEGHDGSIMLLEEPDQLVAVCVRGNDGAQDARQAVGEGIAGLVAETREPLLISGNADPAQFPNLVPRTIPVHSAMCVPLINRDEVLGVLNLNAARDRDFSEYDLRALTLFAEHAAVSIANARLYEQERDRVSELLEVNQMKSDFVATVSHELRTPLTSILGGVVTLRRLELAAEHRDGMLDVIERQGHRLLRLIEQLLSAARLEHEGETRFEDRVDLAALVHTVARDFEATGRPVQVRVPSTSPVLGNSDALQQVLINLLDNAHKYGAPPVRVTVEPRNTETILSVLDAGVGIPEEARVRIFDGFTRLESNGHSPGIGLGLSIVRRLVSACGGAVTVSRSEEGGAAFRVSLATAQQEVPA
ncbi:MAG: GAF domain-containing protein [Actinomycetota bacterium]|nr:GAF domain-containing protein [Actinomycetota bacterium]